MNDPLRDPLFDPDRKQDKNLHLKNVLDGQVRKPPLSNNSNDQQKGWKIESDSNYSVSPKLSPRGDEMMNNS